MAVGVRDTNGQRTGDASHRGLQSIVAGIGHVLQRVDLTDAGSKGTQAVGIWKILAGGAKAGGLQVDEVRLRCAVCVCAPLGCASGSARRDKSKVLSVKRITQCSRNGLAWRETVRSERVV